MSIQNNLTVNKTNFLENKSNFTLKVTAWGKNTIRVTYYQNGCDNDIQLIDNLKKNTTEDVPVKISLNDELISMINGNIKVTYDGNKLIFFNKDIKVLEEFSRVQSNVRRTLGIDDDVPIKNWKSSSLNITPREIKNNSATLIFEGDIKEKVYGMGGYQEKNLNKNLGFYELMHRNSQTSIPEYISNKNYGFIWNNSSIGEASFSKNCKIWKSNCSNVIDYVVTVGNNPKELISNLTAMVGRPPIMSEKYLGLWQSKLRYQNIHEIKSVYREYKRRGIVPSVLVIDYFHWTSDGDFQFDMDYWTGIEEFSRTIKKRGTDIMVSLWPTVSKQSMYYSTYHDKNMLITSLDGIDEMFDGKEILDFSQPETRRFINKLINENYRNKGIELFWADQAEPEMDDYDHQNHTMHAGNMERVGLKYPLYYLKAVQSESSHASRPVLIRSAWFNSQENGALVWSGDVESSFESLKRQIQIGLSMGLSGVSWWTTDIGGFHSGDSTTDLFKELMIRWFQWSVFTPILRMHGDRQPHSQKIGDKGGGIRTSGGPNEIWSFGKTVENILIKFINLRENLKPYIKRMFDESTNSGIPIMRALFIEFPEDTKTLENSYETTYMFGSEILVVPIVDYGVKSLKIWLPAGVDWIHAFSGKEYVGGVEYDIPVDIEELPIFYKKGSSFQEIIKKAFKDTNNGGNIK